MKVMVEMLAFEEAGKMRPVELPVDDVNLEAVYKYGQNMFQNVPGYCSVSVGDVVHWLGGKKIIVQDVGFQELSPEQYEQYKAMPRRDRAMCQFARPVRE